MRASWLAILASLVAFGAARASTEIEAFEPAGRLLQSRCAMPGCHDGPKPAQGMRLEMDQIYRSTINVPAHTDSRFLRVSPGDPEHSLVYLKLLSPHQGGYRGPRMPLSMDPLSEDEIARIRAWIESFPKEQWGQAVPATAAPVTTRAFQDAYLANLPTPDALGAKTMEFRFAHRFKASAPGAGSHGFYGLDSGAWISLELAYGLSDAFEVGLRRTNLEVDYEGYFKWAILRQAAGGSPLALAFRGGVSNVRETDRFNRTRVSGQLVLARQFGAHVSLMLVPTYVTHTNTFDEEDERATGAVGAGGEFRFGPRYAVTGEWIGQTSGVKAPFQSASLGFSVATARHAFQIFLTNTQGVHTDLYAPGGDLDVGDGEFRLGFNISRTFSLGSPAPSPP